MGANSTQEVRTDGLDTTTRDGRRSKIGQGFKIAFFKELQRIVGESIPGKDESREGEDVGKPR